MTYPWNAGEVLAAADLNAEFASKVDYALPTNAQMGTAYTFVAADAEKLTTASNGSAVTLTVPPASSVAWPDNTVLRVVNYGAGAVTIAGGSGVTVTNTSSTIAQYGAAVAIRTGSDAWTVVPFGGGDVPAATVSSPSATGQYTDSGTTYDYYTFTASGTLTVDTAGLADVLVVGGGGSGNTGAGGAGAVTYVTDFYLDVATHTITVGGGGATGGQNIPATPGNKSSIGDLVSVGGGSGYYVNVTGKNEGIGKDGGSGAGSYNGSYSGKGLQGNDGGTSTTTTNSGGGGGAGSAGGNGTSTTGGNGGAGVANSITGSSVTYGGGGGGYGSVTAGTGGAGGGGNGSTSGTGDAGSANTGGGSGAGPSSPFGNSGGSGVVIVRVKV